MDKQDVKIEELAKQRAVDKNNYGKTHISDEESSSLLFMANKIGIDLGCTIYMVNQNLEIIERMEQSRKDFYFTHLKQKETVVQNEISLIDTGDLSLKELCSDGDHSDAEMEMDYYAHLKNIFATGKKNNNIGSPGFTGVWCI